MKKAVRSRIKVTKKGALKRRPMGINHFRAKRSGNQTRAKRKDAHLNTGRLIKKLNTL